MPEDIAYDENFRTEWNSVGDINTVTGTDFVEQIITTSIVEGPGLSLSAFTPTAIEEKRGDIEQAVRSNEKTTEPINVSVKKANYDDQEVTFSVFTGQTNFTVESE